MIYEIADLRVRLLNRCRYSEEFCKNYLSSDQLSPCDIEAKVSQEQFEEEKKLSSEFSDGYIENICLYRSLCLQLPKFSRFLLHSAVLTFQGGAYAFLGKSGTGKSTHTSLWLKYLNGVKILNGDKPILFQNGQSFWAYGTPWNGKEGLGENAKAPLKGMCFLEQAKKNEIVRLTPNEATSLLFHQILLPTEEDGVEKTLELADSLLSLTPIYLLKCDISKEAAKTSFEAMTGELFASFCKEDI